uniref:UPAR/Ly6 domain-containing protein n=1 Tax=Parascaris univalens TaxID=6257 RepID=A0A915C9T9_PARUN
MSANSFCSVVLVLHWLIFRISFSVNNRFLHSSNFFITQKVRINK